jgi:aspartyl-tRNA(Asn)/glutamyl-tRNA(Gln) amidotransferase subunit A
MDILTADAADLSASLASKEVSAEELASHYLTQIDTQNPNINALITVTAERALEHAREADQRRAQGETRSALDGVPMVHKDVFCTKGVLTTCGSRMLANFVAPYNATVVSRCDAAGLVVLGKANMDEFAMGSSNEHSYFGPVRNPWDTTRVPGGSSGGSAASVAAGMTPLATATDTGGSIRQPAAFCGVTGIKPTYGRVSRHGMVAFASSLDQGGVIARSAVDAGMLLSLMGGFDPRDSTSADRPMPDLSGCLEAGVRGLRVGLVEEHFEEGLNPVVAAAVEDAAQVLKASGASIHRVNLRETKLTVPAYYVIALAEASSNLSRYDGVRFGHRAEGVQSLEELYERSRSEGFGEEVQRRIMLGTFALSTGYYDAYYRKAQQLRRIIAEDYARVFESVDMLLCPVAPSLPFRLGENLDDPVAMYLSDIYTCGVNLAGLPALALPAGQHANLPIGVQLVGPAFSEEHLIGAGASFQRDTHWHKFRPSPMTDTAEGSR